MITGEDQTQCFDCSCSTGCNAQRHQQNRKESKNTDGLFFLEAVDRDVQITQLTAELIFLVTGFQSARLFQEMHGSVSKHTGTTLSRILAAG